MGCASNPLLRLYEPCQYSRYCLRPDASQQRIGDATRARIGQSEVPYGKPIDHWMKILDGMKDKKHMERVAALKSGHKLGHGHANALVAHHRAVNGES